MLTSPSDDFPVSHVYTSGGSVHPLIPGTFLRCREVPVTVLGPGTQSGVPLQETPGPGDMQLEHGVIPTASESPEEAELNSVGRGRHSTDDVEVEVSTI